MTTILTGVAVGGIAAFATVDEMVSLTNIGTLFAFMLVCIGVMVLRHKDPPRPRPFKVPLGPYLLPGLGAVSCVLLIYFLPEGSYWRFVGWLMLGLAVYLSYGYTRSGVGQRMGRPSTTPLGLKFAAICFTAVAVGLFVIPHDVAPRELFAEAFDPAAEKHTQTLYGVLIIIGGLVGGARGHRAWFKPRDFKRAMKMNSRVSRLITFAIIAAFTSVTAQAQSHEVKVFSFRVGDKVIVIPPPEGF